MVHDISCNLVNNFTSFHLYLAAYVFIIPCQQRLLSSNENLCKQFRPRSALTERRPWSGYKPFDTLKVFLQEILKKLILNKKSANDNGTIKNTQLA